MAKHECKQGDSYAYDYGCDGIIFDAGWSGAWALISEPTDNTVEAPVAVASGALLPSGDQAWMEMRIAPADTEPIPVGDYILTVQLTNVSLGFKQEIVQEDFEILTQGIPG